MRLIPIASVVIATALWAGACLNRPGGFPPAGFIPVREVTSPRGDFRVAQLMSGEERQTWIVPSSPSVRPYRLPPVALPGGDTSDTAGCLIDYFVSPDGQWILAVQKYVHTVSIAFLYRRGDKATFVPAEARLDDGAWDFFALTAGVRPSDIPAVDTGPRLIAFSSWSPDSRRVAITLTGGPAGREAVDWPCRYYPGSGHFERGD